MKPKHRHESYSVNAKPLLKFFEMSENAYIHSQIPYPFTSFFWELIQTIFILRNEFTLGYTANSMGVLSKEGISQLNIKRPTDGMLIYTKEKQW